jgi:hypothetical protein
MYGINKIGRALESVTKEIVTKHNPVIHKIIYNWHVIVGDKLASLSQPAKVVFPFEKNNNGILHIDISNPGFSLELQSREAMIIDRISVFLGFKAIARIKININSNLSLNKPSKHKSEVSLKPIKDNEALESIADPELKEALRKVWLSLHTKA